MSGAGGGRSLLRVAGGGGRGLSGEGVHGAQELVGDASGLAEPAEEGAVDRGGVIPDGVLAGEEQTRDGLREREKKFYEYQPQRPSPWRLIPPDAHLRRSGNGRSRRDGLSHEIVIVPRRTCRDVRVGAPRPGVGAPPRHHGFLWLP